MSKLSGKICLHFQDGCFEFNIPKRDKRKISTDLWNMLLTELKTPTQVQQVEPEAIPEEGC